MKWKGAWHLKDKHRGWEYPREGGHSLAASTHLSLSSTWLPRELLASVISVTWNSLLSHSVPLITTSPATKMKCLRESQCCSQIQECTKPSENHLAQSTTRHDEETEVVSSLVPRIPSMAPTGFSAERLHLRMSESQRKSKAPEVSEHI